MGNKEHDILPTHGPESKNGEFPQHPKVIFLGGMGLHPGFMGNGELNWGWGFRVDSAILGGLWPRVEETPSDEMWVSVIRHSGSSPNLPVISVHHGDNLPGGHALGQHDIPHGDGTDLH